ncbi:MAG TPA: G8 domain-containing protein, partial [Gammaproteobacteria bacterium]
MASVETTLTLVRMRAALASGRTNALIFAAGVQNTSIASAGVDSMSGRHRSSLLASLLPMFLAVSVFTVLVPEEGRAQSAEQSPWSDPATWPNGKVPAAGDKVIIPRDKNVLLDVSPPPLGGLSIDGKLTFSNDADLELTTEWIMLHGELAIGSEESPHTRRATITLTDNVKGEDVMAGMGDRGIMISGGTLNLHGDRTHAWTK